MGWEWIIYAIIGLIAVSMLLAPKPQSEPPAGLDKIQVPTAEEGIEIGVLFGTRELKGPNVIWYGDLDTVPVKKSS